MKDMTPFNEEARLHILKQYELLDTVDEVAYDNLVVLAASVCNTQMASICIIDEYRQWFKARTGFNTRQTDRCLSFCAHTILQPNEMMVVEDTFNDFRFSDNDMVIGEPHVRFYAGIPLLSSEGVPLGTLAVMDTHPGKITEEQSKMLNYLARQVEAQFELRRSQITLRDQAEELHAAQEAAAAAQKAKQQFLANMNHEIRTPINGIIGMASILSASANTEYQRRSADTLEKSANGLLNVISHVLEVSRNDFGVSDSVIGEVKIGKMVQEICQIVRPSMDYKNLELKINLDESVVCGLAGDRLKIQQIFTHLIGNAIKFTSRGSVEVKVKKVGERPNGTLVRFEVTDTGVGIPREMRAKIFEEFTQVNQDNDRSFGGTGLGLTISKNIAQAIGTQINVVSELGKGSCFWFDIAMPHCQVMPEDLSVDNGSSRECMGRILVVEEDEVTSMALAGNLKSKGCEVEVVRDSAEAISIMRRNKFDLVFMDVRLPDMDGIQAVRSIRHLPFPACMTPVVAMTATMVKECEVLCRSVQINDIISKPISDMTVMESLDKWLVGSAREKGMYLAGKGIESQADESLISVVAEEPVEPMVEDRRLAVI